MGKFRVIAGKSQLVAILAIALLVASPVPASANAPVSSTAPSIAGTAKVGSTLSGQKGSWSSSPAATFTYGWYSCSSLVSTSASALPNGCSRIDVASNLSYTPTISQAGKYLTFAVTATNVSGSSTKWSKSTAPVALAPTNTVPPTVTGSTVIGQTLTATPGTWAGSPTPTYTYAWFRCSAIVPEPTSGLPSGCVAIASATKSTYTTVSADAGTYTTAKVTATNTTGATSYWAMAHRKSGAPYNSVAPVISGTPAVGNQLTSSIGTWASTPAATSTTITWYKCRQAITATQDNVPTGFCQLFSPSVTGSSVTLTTSEIGYYIATSVAQTNANGTNLKFSTSSAGVASAPVNLSVPTISGSGQIVDTLTASIGLWTGFPSVTVNGSWYRCSREVPAATSTWPAFCERETTPSVINSFSSSYQVKAADAGYWISFGVFASNTLGFTHYWSRSIQVTERQTVQTGATGISVSNSGSHACSTLASGTVKCWGWNGNGQLGNGSLTDSSLAVAARIDGVTSISAGAVHTCALITGGSVKCWGSNQYGQLGDGTKADSNVPVDVGITGAVAISSGPYHSCAIVVGGAVKCWGYNGSGELGDGTSVDSSNPVDTGITGAVAISAAMGHTCAIVAGGAVKCWGYNSEGEFGDGTTVSSATPVDTGLTGAVAIAAGLSHTCAIVAGGVVKCWGVNGNGSLGDGTQSSSLTPVDTGISGATSLSTSMYSTCAVLANSSVKCWGSSLPAQLGFNSSLEVTPVDAGLIGVSAVSVGQTYICAMFSDSSVNCYGSNDCGQLGRGNFGTFSQRRIFVGNEFFGYNSTGQLIGNQTTPLANLFPGVISENTRTISMGDNHVCGLNLDGSIKCAGDNNFGQIGYAANTAIQGISSPVSISSGSNHNCVIEADKTVKCWGRNTWGQLGNSLNTDSQTAAAVSGLTSAVMLALGWDHSCALITDGTVKCWGNNSSGQLGNGAVVDSAIPVLVTGVTNAIGIFAGGDHTCAVLIDSSVKCWGANSYGELANGSTTNQLTPALSAGLAGAVSVDMGKGHLCALFANGTVKCAGLNDRGQLGNGTIRNSSTLQTVVGLQNVDQLLLGNDFAVVATSTLHFGWGDDSLPSRMTGLNQYTWTPAGFYSYLPYNIGW